MWNRILIFNRYESAMKSYFIHTFQVRILSQTQISKEVHMNLNSVELYNIIQCLILFQKIQLHLKYAFKSRKPFRFVNSLSISLSCWCRFLSENCIWYGIYDTPDFPIFMNVQWLYEIRMEKKALHGIVLFLLEKTGNTSEAEISRCIISEQK